MDFIKTINVLCYSPDNGQRKQSGGKANWNAWTEVLDKLRLSPFLFFWGGGSHLQLIRILEILDAQNFQWF